MGKLQLKQFILFVIDSTAKVEPGGDAQRDRKKV